MKFSKEIKGSYNPKTSKYDVKEKVFDIVPCNISPLSPQRTNLEYGDVTKDINVIRLNGRFEPKVTHAYIKDVKYIITKRINYEHDTVFYAEEVK
nr:MAG TPA: head closure knob [Caudoviricetes sp.]